MGFFHKENGKKCPKMKMISKMVIFSIWKTWGLVMVESHRIEECKIAAVCRSLTSMLNAQGLRALPLVKVLF